MAARLTVQQLFATLSTLCASAETTEDSQIDKEIIRVADQILKESPLDPDAAHAKLISLLRLEKYESALRVIQANPTLDAELVFEKAYCFYRTNRLEDALKVIRLALKKSNVGIANDDGSDTALSDEVINNLKYLEAQVLYRAESFNECIECHRGLLEETQTDDSIYDELLVNYAAARAALLLGDSQSDGQVLQDKYLESSLHGKSSEVPYEMLYNAGCIQVALGNLEAAKDLLKLARSLCRETLKAEDYTDSEIEAEVSTMDAQLGYVYHLQQNVVKAWETYQTLLESQIADKNVLATVNNNVTAIQREHKLYESMKLIESCRTQSTQMKLTSHQNRIIAYNKAVLNLHHKKRGQSKRIVQDLVEKYPDFEEAQYLLNYLNALSKPLGKKGSKKIGVTSTNKGDSALLRTLNKAVFEDWVARCPTLIVARLALAQLYINESNYASALDVIQKSPMTNIALVSIKAWLLEKLGRSEDAKRELQTISNLKSESLDAKTLYPLAKHKLLFAPSSALEDFTKLVKSDPTNTAYIAGLVLASVAVKDVQTAKKYVSYLPNVAVPQSVDVSQLLKGVGLRGYKMKQVGIGPKDQKRRLVIKAKNRKRRIAKMKSFDPNVTPDPERWLPKHLRSANVTAEKGKKKKGKDLNRGPQGLAVADATAGTGITGSANILGLGGSDKNKGKGKEKEVVVEEGEKSPAPPSANTGKQTQSKKKKGKKGKF